MSLDLKTVLFYVVSAIFLIGATTLFQVDQNSELAVSFEMTATPTPFIIPTVTPLPPTRVRIEAGPLGCITTPWGGPDGYRPNAPFISRLGAPGIKRIPLIISGRIFAADCVTPLPGALIEVWQTNPEGSYSASDFRARLVSDAEGRYEFTTIRPSPAIAASQFRPARIHYRVSYPQAPTLVTQIFFEGDPVLKRQVTSSAQRRLIRPLIPEAGPGGAALRSTFDITLAVDPPG